MLEYLLAKARDVSSDRYLNTATLPSYLGQAYEGTRGAGYQREGDLESQLSGTEYISREIFSAFYKGDIKPLTKNDYKASKQPKKPKSIIYELKVVRRRRYGYDPLTIFRASHDVYAMFRKRFEQTDREEFLVLLLDGKNKLLGFNVVSIGSLTSSLVHPREVYKPAILGNAAAIILVHNHPSGEPTPSQEDIEITKRLREVGDLHGIRVLDHIVIGDGGYVSFVDDGYFS